MRGTDLTVPPSIHPLVANPVLLHTDHPTSDAMFSIAQLKAPLSPPEPPPMCLRPPPDEDDEDEIADLPMLVEDVSSDKE